MEVNFYHIDNIDYTAIALLATKILDENHKAIIYCTNQEVISKLDSSLWSHGRNKFLPHITIYDKDFNFMRQPIVITNNQENINQSSYLILLNSANKEFLEKFDRLFCFIEKDSHLEKDIKSCLDNNCQINSYKKDSNKWIKIN